MFLRRSLMPVLSIGLCACATHSAPPTGTFLDGQECPVILLARRGGLGYESRSGLIAAVWPSGKIVRAESYERPWAQHVVGQLSGEDSAVLQDLLNAPTTWAEPSGEVALDMSEDVLTLRRAGEKRQWAETPGVTSAPILSKFRRALRDVIIDGARRTGRPVEIPLECQ